jgi:hypothetical protein
MDDKTREDLLALAESAEASGAAFFEALQRYAIPKIAVDQPLYLQNPQNFWGEADFRQKFFDAVDDKELPSPP